MKIRKAIKKDIPRMFEIIKINSPKYPKQLAYNELSEMFSKSLFKPTYIIVEKGKEIVAFGGFIPSWIDNAVFNVFWINTNPEYKKQGVGIKLMKEIINQIKKYKKPKPKMILISTKILKFYEKFGFKKITSKYDKDYILMEKKIK